MQLLLRVPSSLSSWREFPDRSTNSLYGTRMSHIPINVALAHSRTRTYCTSLEPNAFIIPFAFLMWWKIYAPNTTLYITSTGMKDVLIYRRGVGANVEVKLWWHMRCLLLSRSTWVALCEMCVMTPNCLPGPLLSGKRPKKKRIGVWALTLTETDDQTLEWNEILRLRSHCVKPTRPVNH